MVQKTILKNDSQRAVIHLVGDQGASESSLVALADLVNTGNGETSSGALKVNISGIWATSNGAVDSSIVIMRGTSTVLVANGNIEYPGSQQMPSLSMNNGNDIRVIFNGRGTISLDVRKVEGFVQPNRNVGV